MASKPISPIRQAWYKWKSLHFPWRRRVLVGFDLKGYTYWEFRIAGSNPNSRWRRIVHYPAPSTTPRSRSPRMAPHAELARQARIKALASQADARWAAKPKLAAKPAAQAVPNIEASRAAKPEEDAIGAKPGTVAGAGSPQEQQSQQSQPPQDNKTPAQDEPVVDKADPWAAARARAKGPSENWQPDTWAPSKAKR
ncbi:unnamed protein product [Parascedosporium putredinis]|uniref:NADH dehydrogenase [ubiquinone] 1 alpha subcomplex subunit n=1 Tax=Parascedosporium putredinis TaxID=1442378 RepID=A0A9P1HBV2_9PEZI|nr:unnamed protein product [Parascedosporium putredinis]CAI8003143.1 unnamed protein product [Parascedosporium putredinis]